MSFGSISASKDANGQVTVIFQTTLDGATDIHVDYGVDTNYGFSSDPGQGTQTAPADPASGLAAYQVVFSPGANPFVHFSCTAAGRPGSDVSADQVFSDGSQAGPPPTVVTGPSGAVITWNTDQPGVGMVVYRQPADTVDFQESEDASATSHRVELTDLVGKTTYTCHYETDLDDSDVTIVSNPFTFTTPDLPVDLLGHVCVSARPVRIKADGGKSTITVQVRKRDGSPQAGYGVAFSLGAGKMEGSLSDDTANTDVNGRCQVVFTGKSIPAGRKKARRFIVVVVSGGGKTKRKRAVVVGFAA